MVLNLVKAQARKGGSNFSTVRPNQQLVVDVGLPQTKLDCVLAAKKTFRYEQLYLLY